MKEIWIIGAGRFGRLAAERLSDKEKDLHLVLVDLLPEKLREATGNKRTLVQSDGAAFLLERLYKNEGRPPDWIIPAVPVHLAAELLLLVYGKKNLARIPVPQKADLLLPNPVRLKNGNIFVSHADFLCPDDCAEPRRLCTFTGKPRKQNMFELLANIQLPGLKSLVIRSRQLGAGIGGYGVKDLLDLARRVEEADGPVLISTACRCHGVITGLSARIDRSTRKNFIQKNLAISTIMI